MEHESEARGGACHFEAVAKAGAMKVGIVERAKDDIPTQEAAFARLMLQGTFGHRVV